MEQTRSAVSPLVRFEYVVTLLIALIAAYYLKREAISVDIARVQEQNIALEKRLTEVEKVCARRRE